LVVLRSLLLCSGLGIFLVLVVGIGWRCSPAGHEPCHALCHLNETPSGGGGATTYDTGTQRATRIMHRSRNQWYAGRSQQCQVQSPEEPYGPALFKQLKQPLISNEQTL